MPRPTQAAQVKKVVEPNNAIVLGNLKFLVDYNPSKDKFKLRDHLLSLPRKRWYTRQQLLLSQDIGLLEVDEFLHPDNHSYVKRSMVVINKENDSDEEEKISESQPSQESILPPPNPVFLRASKRLRSNNDEVMPSLPYVAMVSRFNRDPDKMLLPSYMVINRRDLISLKGKPLPLPDGEVALMESALEENQVGHAIEMCLLFCGTQRYKPTSSMTFTLINDTIRHIKVLKSSTALSSSKVEIPVIHNNLESNEEEYKEEIKTLTLKSSEEDKIFNEKVKNLAKEIFNLNKLLMNLFSYLDKSDLVKILDDIRNKKELFWQWIELLISFLKVGADGDWPYKLKQATNELFKHLIFLLEIDLRQYKVESIPKKVLASMLSEEYSWPYTKIDNIIAILFENLDYSNLQLLRPIFHFHHLLVILSHVNLICQSSLIHSTFIYYKRLNADYRELFLNWIVSLPFKIRLVHLIITDQFSSLFDIYDMEYIDLTTIETLYLKLSYKEIVVKLYKNNANVKLNKEGLPIRLAKEAGAHLYRQMLEYLHLLHTLLSSVSIVYNQSNPNNTEQNSSCLDLKLSEVWKPYFQRQREEILLIDQALLKLGIGCDKLLATFDFLFYNREFF